MYECIFVMLSELRTGGPKDWCLRYCLSFSVSIKKREKPTNNTDSIPRIVLLITI